MENTGKYSESIKSILDNANNLIKAKTGSAFDSNLAENIQALTSGLAKDINSYRGVIQSASTHLNDFMIWNSVEGKKHNSERYSKQSLETGVEFINAAVMTALHAMLDLTGHKSYVGSYTVVCDDICDLSKMDMDPVINFLETGRTLVNGMYKEEAYSDFFFHYSFIIKSFLAYCEFCVYEEDGKFKFWRADGSYARGLTYIERAKYLLSVASSVVDNKVICVQSVSFTFSTALSVYAELLKNCGISCVNSSFSIKDILKILTTSTGLVPESMIDDLSFIVNIGESTADGRVTTSRCMRTSDCIDRASRLLQIYLKLLNMDEDVKLGKTQFECLATIENCVPIS